MKSVDVRQLEQFRDALRAMAKDTDAIMDELLVGEGEFAVERAQRLCKRDNVIDTGYYHDGFHADKTARRIGKTYRGMYVGPKDGFVPGHYVMERAKTQTQKSQDARLKRKLNAILKRYLGGAAG